MESKAEVQLLDTASCSRTDAIAVLFRILSHAFSYPSIEQATWRTSLAFFRRTQELLSVACSGSSPLEWDMDALDADAEDRAHALRVEHTRLFVVSPRVVPLVGTRWVTQPASLAERQSERARVQRIYNQLGLCNRAGVTEPADHIVSELDYASYVTAAESQAWQGEDAASASEWKLLRDVFINRHLYDLALGVAEGIAQHSQNPHLCAHAQLLTAVVQTCVP